MEIKFAARFDVIGLFDTWEYKRRKNVLNIYRFIYIVACIPSISLVDGKSDEKVWRIHFTILR